MRCPTDSQTLQITAISICYLPKDHIAEDTHTLESQNMGKKKNKQTGTNLEASSYLIAFALVKVSSDSIERKIPNSCTQKATVTTDLARCAH